ncbi:hypothetical protein [Macrococcus hajekii]|nr:hypothetical protein [Macrococcus hajekii]
MLTFGLWFRKSISSRSGAVCVPMSVSSHLTTDLARDIAAQHGLKYVEALVRTGGGSSQQAIHNLQLDKSSG